MLSLTHLYAAGKDIVELTGLEHATNLTYLNLGVAFRQGSGVPEVRANRITDISALSRLAALRWLNLGDNQVTDISALSGLTNLETLILYANQVTDISALSGMVRLSYLDLGRNRITDASALAGLVNLVWLDMSNNQLADISPLSGLIALETLSLDRTGLESIHALSALQNLRSLSLAGNRITEIAGLSGLTSLETVILYGNKITAVPALSNLPNLKSLALGINRITDISGLTGLPSLEAVDLKHNQITAIPPLAELQNLRILDCENNLITDISGLSGLPALEAVTLKGNRLIAVPALTGLPSLRLLELAGNQISEVPDLSGLPNLEMLDLEYNLITAIPAMPGLPNLKSLSLGDNYIADISGLSELTGLESLDLLDNEITDVSILVSLFSLAELDLRYNPLDENTYSEVLPVIKANNPGIDLISDPSPWAFGPRPYNGADNVTLRPVLLWTTGAYTAQHDLYFGENEQAVADANGITDTTGIYRGRYDLDVTSYDPGILEPNKTYYWRIDEVNETESWSPISGTVWSFTTADFIVVDDFELYDDNADANQAIFQTWLDGYGYGSPISGPYYEGNGTGSSVGYWKAPFVEQTIVHGGKQSMPLDYNNVDLPWYSQSERKWPTPQDWTVNGADTLQMFFIGSATNGLSELYVAIEDAAGQVVLVSNPDPNAVRAIEWQEWSIPLVELSIAGVDVTAIRKMAIGVGDPANPQPDGAGRIYIDDIHAIKSESTMSAKTSTVNIESG
jgi:internalin A